MTSTIARGSQVQMGGKAFLPLFIWIEIKT